MIYHRHILNAQGLTSLGVPDTISGLVAWHRFDVSDYLTLDGSNNVLYSTDLSPNGNDFEDNGTPPVYNGSGYIQGGVLDTITGKNFLDVAAFDAFYVLNRNNVTGSAVQALSISTSVVRNFSVGIHPVVYRIQVTSIDPVASYTAAVPLTASAATFQLHNVSHLSGTSYVNINNGTEQSGSTRTPTDYSSDTTSLNLSNTANQYKEVIVYNRRLDAGERTQVKDYLNAKYTLY